ncbi:MAG: HDOD domain-containing protein [Deltaproteobacteria bacterium]|nr:HDOD domain-containing protein [Deltaproteobacteria bacterium]
MRSQKALKLVEEEENLPVLPQLFYRIVEAASNPETPVSKLSSLILEDQVLTGRVLRMANSAYYSMPQKISTVTRAVMVLGFITLKNFITAATVVDTLYKGGFKGGLYETFWIHALTCSLLASLLAEKLKVDQREVAMVAGLVHDCGKLFLDYHFPETYRKVAEETLKGRDFLAAERKFFGVTHVDVGEKIARKWGLPAALIEAIRDHHRFSGASKDLALSDVVYMADLLSPYAIPESWADRIGGIYPKESPDECCRGIWVGLGLTEETIQRLIESAKQNVQRVAEDLNLTFLSPSAQDLEEPSPEIFRLQREMERKERQLAMVNEISGFILENPRPEELIQIVLEAVHRGIGFNRTLLFLLDGAGKTVAGKFGLGHDVPPFLKSISVPIDSDGLMGRAIREKRAFNVVDSNSRSCSDLPRLEVPVLAEIKTFALVPFIAGREVIGLVMVDNSVTREPIRDQEVELIRTFLTLAGVYLESYSKRPD